MSRAAVFGGTSLMARREEEMGSTGLSVEAKSSRVGSNVDAHAPMYITVKARCDSQNSGNQTRDITALNLAVT